MPYILHGEWHGLAPLFGLDGGWMGWGMGVAQRVAAEVGGCNRNALPLRSEPSSTKLENTSLSTEVPLEFLYAASPFLRYKAETATFPSGIKAIQDAISIKLIQYEKKKRKAVGK